MREEDNGFLDEVAGVGLDTITASEKAQAFLSMVQPDSSATEDGATPGHWRNSATGEDLGEVVTVVPLAFRTIWSERSKEPPFGTIGRYDPHSIKVDIQQPKDGKGYPKMINPDTGNEIQELYVYAVMLPEHPEMGVLLFNPTVVSMRTCKSWNTQLTSQLLDNGKQAPIFAYPWDLAVTLVDNPKKKGGKVAKFVKVSRGSAVITRDLFDSYVKPQLPLIQQAVLSITSNIEDGE